AARESGSDGAQVDFGLAAAGNAIEQADRERSGIEPSFDFAKGTALVFVEHIGGSDKVSSVDIFGNSRFFPEADRLPLRQARYRFPCDCSELDDLRHGHRAALGQDSEHACFSLGTLETGLAGGRWRDCVGDGIRVNESDDGLRAGWAELDRWR